MPVDESLFQETHGAFNILGPLQQPLGKLRLYSLAQLFVDTWKDNRRERQLATSPTLSQKRALHRECRDTEFREKQEKALVPLVSPLDPLGEHPGSLA